ncbi:GspH/FimT family pseudopilin [Pelobacter seleniigenes]|uniref:GspH/FimT family pseudopilin n=1 Tax=Pelobacter seleniigenes TaxID=407188 RepID=UPI00068A08B8|nr:GspH/FimT family pseudopilin [Pelobacter seleniigenes]
MNITSDLQHTSYGGFTLLELIIAMTVMGILMLTATPPLRSYIRTNHVTAAANDLVGALNYARSEAVSRQINVTVCQSFDLEGCDSSGWEQGWIIFTDENGDANVDGTDSILRAHNTFTTDISISSAADAIIYQPTGFLASPSGGDAISITANNKEINVIVNSSGSMRTE